MPAIPVVFNKDFSISSGKLGKIESRFYCNAVFTDTSLSNHWKLALAEGFATATVEDTTSKEEAAD